MKGRNIKRDPETGFVCDEEGYLYYWSNRPYKGGGWQPKRRGRKHLRIEDMARRMSLIAQAKAGEITLEQAQAVAKAAEGGGR